MASSPSTSDDEREIASSSRNEGEGQGQSHVKRIVASGMHRGIVRFQIEWEDEPSDTDEYFYALPSQEPCIEYYRTSTTIPSDIRQDAKDIAAGNPHYACIDQGYLRLLDSILEEGHRHEALAGYSDHHLSADIFEILCSIPVAVLRGICGAGLQARKGKDEDLLAWLSNNLRKSERRPAIYMTELTSRRGHPPSLGHMREFARAARAYLHPQTKADFDDIVRIDEKSSASNFTAQDERERRTLDTRTWLVTKEDEEKLEALLDKLDENIHNFSQTKSDDSVFPYPLRDIGYSDEALQRLEAQEGLNTTSNRTMSLFNAIAQFHPDPAIHKRRYRVWCNVIFLGFRRSHIAIGELVFSILAQSYCSTGKGFNSVPAGVQVSSNTRYDIADFERWQDDILKMSPFHQNAAAETERDKKLHEDLALLDEECMILQVEILRREVHLLRSIESRMNVLRAFMAACAARSQE